MISVVPNLTYVADNDGAVILDMGHNTITTLNTVGAFVWDRFSNGIQFEEIVRELATKTGAPHDTVRKDVDIFVEQLIADKLLVSYSSHEKIGWL